MSMLMMEKPDQGELACGEPVLLAPCATKPRFTRGRPPTIRRTNRVYRLNGRTDNDRLVAATITTLPRPRLAPANPGSRNDDLGGSLYNRQRKDDPLKGSRCDDGRQRCPPILLGHCEPPLTRQALPLDLAVPALSLRTGLVAVTRAARGFRNSGQLL